MTREVIDGLLNSDPAIRWQVMRDLLDAPAEDCGSSSLRQKLRSHSAKGVTAAGWGCLPFLRQEDSHA